MLKRLSLLLALAAIGCATVQTPAVQDEEPSGPPPPKGMTRQGFPTPEALTALATTPAPTEKELFGSKPSDVDAWDLAGPLPETIGYTPASENGPWASALAAAARSRPGMALLSTSMECVAREVGRFFLKNKATPSDRLRKFISGRCGGTTSTIAAAYVAGEIPAGEKEAATFERWKANLAPLLQEAIAPGERWAGIWFGREGKQGVAMVVWGLRGAHVEPVAIRASGGIVELRGEVLDKVEEITGMVTRGRFGLAHCEDDPAVRPPRFHLKCPVDAQDATAWIQLMARPPGRFLSYDAVDVLALPGADEGKHYSSPAYSATKAAEGAFEATFAGLLNAVRAEAGLAPVELSVAQSQSATELAPHYFAAMFGREPETNADLVMLGLRAGWKVDGLVRYGHVVADAVIGSDEPGRLLAGTLQMPIGREALLDPEVRTLAVGSLCSHEVRGLAAVFGTYAKFEQADTAQFREKVLQALAKARAAAGLGAPESLPEVATYVPELEKRIQSGKLGRRQAMNEFMNEAAARSSTGGNVRAFVMQSWSLDGLQFPPELLKNPALHVGVAVAVSRSEGDAWGTYTIVLVTVETQDA